MLTRIKWLERLRSFFSVTVALLTLATVGAGLTTIAVFVALPAIFDQTPLSEAIERAMGGRSLLEQMAVLGFAGGVFGLVYIQAGLAYLLFFRRIPHFWRRIPIYFSLLTLATIAVPILIALFVEGTPSQRLGLIMFAPSLGFWLMTVVIFCLGRGVKSGSERSALPH